MMSQSISNVLADRCFSMKYPFSSLFKKLHSGYFKSSLAHFAPVYYEKSIRVL